MRFGLVGTGYWAKITHAPALASTPGAELAAVWGRDPAAAAALAAGYGATAHAGLRRVPRQRGRGRVRGAAARPGTARDPRRRRRASTCCSRSRSRCRSTDADRLVTAVEEAGVASVVFFTWRFNTEIRAWLTDEQARGGWSGEGWSGGAAIWLGTSLADGQPVQHARGGGRRARSGTSARTSSACSGPASARSPR